MRILYDIFGSLLINMRVGISSAKQWTIEQFTVFRNNRSRWHVVKRPVNSYFYWRKETEVDPETMSQLRWSST